MNESIPADSSPQTSYAQQSAKPKRRWLPTLVAIILALGAGVGVGYSISLPRIDRLQSDLQWEKDMRAKEETAKESASEPAAEESEKPVDDPPLSIGKPAIFNDGTKITVYKFDPEVAADGPQPDSDTDKWVAADLEVCVAEDSYISSLPWSIRDTENHNFTPSSTGYNSFPEPNYTWGDEALSSGDCRRGWLVFVVNKDADLTTISYNGGDGYYQVEWNVQ